MEKKIYELSWLKFDLTKVEAMYRFDTRKGIDFYGIAVQVNGRIHEVTFHTNDERDVEFDKLFEAWSK